jgi:pyruvate kinase
VPTEEGSAPEGLSESTKLGRLIARLDEIRSSLAASEASLATKLERVDPSYRLSARNLAHYLALRRQDIRELQKELATLGLSSLGRAEAHVMATIDAVVGALHGLAGHGWSLSRASPDFLQGRSLLEEHTRALLGSPPQSRSVRIMVTMPTEAASDYHLVRKLVAGGMDCMRINCAYDDERAWARMIEHLTRAKSELGRDCRVVMDLAGPKLRVGPVEPGPEVMKLRQKRDALGRVMRPARIRLVPAGLEERRPLTADVDAVLPVAEGAVGSLRAGQILTFTDARGARRKLTVSSVGGECAVVECDQSSYLTSGTELRRKGDKGTVERFKIGVLPALRLPIILKPGDTLFLSKQPCLGRGARQNGDQVVAEAIISCNIPEILDDVRSGERVWFDDGKIGGVIKEVSARGARIAITQAADAGSKLAENKGINLPDSNLRIPCFTAKDLEDLPFVAAHADLIEMSFVREPRDIEQLEAQLARFADRTLGIVLKIETRRAFENLPELVFAAMRRPAAGVMIARGDLAVECGWERLAEVQEEILWICEAAHLPVIWATQVLEGLAKKGQPSRAEITDAAMAERAECVMLNKGPYIVEALKALDDILRRMQAHQVKKTAMLRRLRW